MNVVRHLWFAHRIIYLWFWGVLALIFTAMMSSFQVFGHWIVGDDEHASIWRLSGTQAPLWFQFVIGIMLASTRLPVAIANGVTRRDFSLGAFVFALGSAVLFGLVNLAGYGGEILVYRAGGIMDELTAPYPYPTVESFASTIASYLAFLFSGWLIGLLFYRLPVWWALALTPVAALPMGAGSVLPYTRDISYEFGVWLALAALAGIASYGLARSVPVRPKKA